MRNADAHLYELLVNSIRDYAIIALDATGHIAIWNPGAERFNQFTAKEAVGRYYSICFTPEDIENGKPARQLETAKRDGRFADEGWLSRKDGTRYWASVVITALRDEHGAFCGFAKVTRDLTERRLADQALRESEERFRLIVQSVRDYGIFMLDPTGRVVSWNIGAERIKGYSATDIIGRHFSTFYPQEDLDARKPERELEVASR